MENRNILNKEQIIEILQKFLNAEIAGRDLYLQQSKNINDPSLIQTLKSFASTESGHIINIRDKITELGGKPHSISEVSNIQKGLSDASYQVSAPLDMLRIDLKIEETAINDYTAATEIIEDEGVKTLIENNLAEEIHHSLHLSKKINEVLEKSRNKIGAISSIEQPGGKAPSEIFKASVEVGLLRLNRSWLEMFMSGLIAGMNVTFGIIASSYVAGATEPLVGGPTSKILGALFFPIGFMFLLIGKSELFTENFLLPVTTVLARKTKIRRLFKLWGLTLAGNMGGIFLFALIIASSLGLLLPVFVVNHIHTVAYSYMSKSPYIMVLSGVFAGWLITLMTWLLIASNGTLARIIIIWAVGFMIYLGSFSHIVVASSEILISINSNSGMSYIPWLIKFVPLTIIGNMIGGLVFVTVLQYLQILHAGGKTEMSLYSSSELDMLSKAVDRRIEDVEDTL